MCDRRPKLTLGNAIAPLALKTASADGRSSTRSLATVAPYTAAMACESRKSPGVTTRVAPSAVSLNFTSERTNASCDIMPATRADSAASDPRNLRLAGTFLKSWRTVTVVPNGDPAGIT